jgi:hypothetical protein
MTGSEDPHSNTRPISVAELLAKNGTIGSPPVGGRRRRRRGNSDSVTVAELTGEIPVVSEHDVQDDEDGDEDAAEDVATDDVVAEDVHAHPVAPRSNGAARYAETDYPDDDEYDDGEYAAPQSRPEPPRGHYAHALRYHGAEQMSPDPLINDVEADDDVDVAVDDAIADAEDTDLVAHDDDGEELPSYIRARQGTLFGGPQTMADDLARAGSRPRPEEIDLEDEDEAEVEQPQSGMSTFLRGAWVVVQSIIAVAFGAGLFIAFDQLWKWNNIVALVLSVLVILGLVVGVRVVRKTEDIGSTLIAVAVGALVTLGPLALLQSN